MVKFALKDNVYIFFQNIFLVFCFERLTISNHIVLWSICPILQHSQAYFGAGTGPILLDGVGCSGNEAKISDCYHNGWRIHDCIHDEDAGVLCTGTIPGKPLCNIFVFFLFHCILLVLSEGEWGCIQLYGFVDYITYF